MNFRFLYVPFLLCVLLAPHISFAFPFGGQASIVRPCYNSAIFARLGAPRGGDFIWTPSTRTYQFGAPRSVGQWLLGLASVPYQCVVSFSPIDVWPGVAIMMMGSSQSSGFNFGGGTPGGGVPPTQTRTLGSDTGLANQSAVQHLLISEVFAVVDSAHGTDPENEWIEIYNPTDNAFTFNGWTLADASTTVTLPAGATIQPRGYLVVTASQNTRGVWAIPTTTPVIVLPKIASGLDVRDRLIFSDSNGLVLDTLSWGGDTSQFQPSIAQPQPGQSIIRSTLSKDTDLGTDWVITSAPNPGR